MGIHKTRAWVMARRNKTRKQADFYPTPLPATRQFLTALEKHRPDIRGGHVWEPAAGDGAMARVLREVFGTVVCSDAYSYGLKDCEEMDFLSPLDTKIKLWTPNSWVITNPPFHSAGDFVRMAFMRGAENVAILARLQFVESRARWNSLFCERPPAMIFPFVDRVGMMAGELDENASSAVAYSWFCWWNNSDGATRMEWLSGRHADFTREGDWE